MIRGLMCMIINKNTFLPNTHDPENTAERWFYKQWGQWSHGHHCHFTFAVYVKLKLSSSSWIRRRFRALLVAASKHISACWNMTAFLCGVPSEFSFFTPPFLFPYFLLLTQSNGCLDDSVWCMVSWLGCGEWEQLNVCRVARRSQWRWLLIFI